MSDLLGALKAVGELSGALPENVLFDIYPKPEGLTLTFRCVDPRCGARGMVSWVELEAQPDVLIWIYQSTFSKLQRVLEDLAKEGKI